MIEKHQEAELLRSLAQAYQQITESPARGNVGGGDRDDLADGRNAVAAGGNAFGGGVTPWRGLGRQYTGNKDKAAKKFKDQQKKDRAAERGISDKDRKARAKANKEKRINKEGEAYLKQLQGKK